MPWFKVDDGLHSHKKAVRAGAGAMGLWVLAGSWCADQLSDGFVPDYIAARLDPNYETNAARLVDTGFWTAAETDGDKGWQFHDWEDHQPTAEQVRAERVEARERMRRAREAKKAASSASVRPNIVRTSSEHGAHFGRSSGEVTVTRPDPTRPTSSKELDTGAELPLGIADDVADGTITKPSGRRSSAYDYDSDPDFLRFWLNYPLKVGKPNAFKAWQAAIKRGANPEMIIAAAQQYRNNPKRKPDMTKHPQGWLNDERYNAAEAEAPPQERQGGSGGAWWDN